MSKSTANLTPGRRKPFELMQELLAKERAGVYAQVPDPGSSREQPCDTNAANKTLRAALGAKHDVGTIG